MNTIFDIADQLRACIFEHVRTIVEPDDAAILVVYLESQGYLSKAALALKWRGRRVHPRFLSFRNTTDEQFNVFTEAERDAFQSDYSNWLETEPGLEGRFAAELAAAENASISAGAVELAKLTPGSGPQEPLTAIQARIAENAKSVEIENPQTGTVEPDPTGGGTMRAAEVFSQ